MSHVTVEAQNVQVGDQMFNSLATHPAFQWVRVKEVTTEDNQTRIITSGWMTIKHPREGVDVKRTRTTTE